MWGALGAQFRLLFAYSDRCGELWGHSFGCCLLTWIDVGSFGGAVSVAVCLLGSMWGALGAQFRLLFAYSDRCGELWGHKFGCCLLTRIDVGSFGGTVSVVVCLLGSMWGALGAQFRLLCAYSDRCGELWGHSFGCCLLTRIDVGSFGGTVSVAVCLLGSMWGALGAQFRLLFAYSDRCGELWGHSFGSYLLTRMHVGPVGTFRGRAAQRIRDWQTDLGKQANRSRVTVHDHLTIIIIDCYHYYRPAITQERAGVCTRLRRQAQGPSVGGQPEPEPGQTWSAV